MRKFTLPTVAAALASLALSAHAQLPGHGADVDVHFPLRQLGQFEPFEQTPSSDAMMPGRAVAATKSSEVLLDAMLDLNAWLGSERPRSLARSAGFVRELSRDDQHALGLIECSDCADQFEQQRRQLVGVALPLDHVVDLSHVLHKQQRGDSLYAGGALRGQVDGGFAWTVKLSSPGAAGLRISLSGLDLPANAAIYVFNDRGEAFGPYIGRGVAASGTLTTNMVSGDTAFLQLRVSGAPQSMDSLRFTIDSIGHISPRFGLAAALDEAGGLSAKVHCTSGRVNESCVENAECYGSNRFSHIDKLRKSTAAMLFQSGSGFYICSGGLINNAADDPLFLTANHCISKSNEANTLEVYWNHTVPCGTRACQAAWQVQGRASEVGATILSTASSGDYNLMRLHSTLPSGAFKLGWSATAVANTANVPLYRISHPNGAPQAYSEHRVNTTAGTCRTLARGTYIYSTDTLGATEGGSSGSPVVNADGLIVGQLYGACGTNVNDVCDVNSNRTVDGAFAAYFSQVESHLTSGGGGTPPGGFALTGTGSKVQGRWRASLSWSGASGNVDVRRQGSVIATNVGGTSYIDQTDFRGSGSLTYQVCNTGTSTCSNEVTISF